VHGIVTIPVVIWVGSSLRVDIPDAVLDPRITVR
jgi:hypothetical protein